MLPKNQLNRINELAQIAKKRDLTPEEFDERKALRKAYLHNFRFGFTNMVEGLKIVDEENNDITPKKLVEIQKEKGIHSR